MRLDRDQARTLLILLGLCAAFGLGLLVPRQVKFARLRKQIDTSKGQLGTDRKNAAGLVQLARKVKKFQEIVSGAQHHVPQESDLAPLIKQLSSDLKEQRVQEKEIQTHNAVTGPNYNTIPITLRFAATFPKTYEFLKKVESNRRLIRVEHLAITERQRRGRSEDTEDEPLEIQLRLRAFFSPGQASRS